MSKLDSGLRYLAGSSENDWSRLASTSAFSLDVAPVGAARARLLVEAVGGIEPLLAAGFRPRLRVGNVWTGDIAVDALESLESIAEVKRAEISWRLRPELNAACPEARVVEARVGPPECDGQGVIVGIIDSGIDYRHPSFRGPDGKSRILAIWDQRSMPLAGEKPPDGFDYGVEYVRTAIDAALASANPLSIVRHNDSPPFHGTHVAGIAAGNGEPGNPEAGGVRFVGVAPGAELVVVASPQHVASPDGSLGNSSELLEAVSYIVGFAERLERPVVVNLSQGGNLGPHDGTTLLEQGLANLVSGPGRVLVKSAGNEGTTGCHAAGELTPGGAQQLEIVVADDTTEVAVDLWYPGADRIALRVTPPEPAIDTTTFNAPLTDTVALSNGNVAFIDLDLDDPANGDNRIFVVLQPGSGGFVQRGTWTFHLLGTGAWHAWIQRGCGAHFGSSFANQQTTISIPGTTDAVIAVGSYVSNGLFTGTDLGTLSTFSSRGPTRDGRRAPALAAPGEELTAPQPGSRFGPRKGTSMSAPMVAGTVALMLQVSPLKTAIQIRRCLEDTARGDAQTGAVPNPDWGSGKLDAAAAVQRALNDDA